MQPYTMARQQLPEELAHLQSLTSDNPSQQDRIHDLRATLERRLLVLQKAIDMHRQGGANLAPALLLTGSGKREMDRLRSITDAMEAEENRLLVIRTAIASRSTARAQYAVVLASTLDFLLLLFTFWQFVRERRLRICSRDRCDRTSAALDSVSFCAMASRSPMTETLEDRVRVRTTELERINGELEAFSYSVSHDLRAPLRTIDGFSLALQEDYAGAIDDTGKDYINRVRRGVQRMGLLIDALLQLSRITRAEIVREEFNISALAESVAAELQEQEKNCLLSFHIEPGLTTHADPRLTRVALANLIGNAVNFSSKVASPEIRFGWDSEQSACTFGTTVQASTCSTQRDSSARSTACTETKTSRAQGSDLRP